MFCKYCGNELQESWNVCTNCGTRVGEEAPLTVQPTTASKPSGKLTGRLILGLAGLLMLVGFYLAIQPKPTGSRPPSPATGSGSTSRASSASLGNLHRISGENFFGCADRAYYSELVDYAVAKDRQAFSQALAAGIASGNCVLFKPGEEVYISDTALFSGMVQVRRKGETKRFWTAFESTQ